MGAVSITTNFWPASRMTREKAWNTAISSVQGERRSSSSSARPSASSVRAFRLQHMLPVALGFGMRVDPADRRGCPMSHPAFRRDWQPDLSS